jgi:hypothetical protein
MVAPIPAQFRPLSSDRRRASGTQSVKRIPLLLITSLQPQYFPAITHSFAQWKSIIPRNINSLRTLSVVTEVCALQPPNPLCASVANPTFSAACHLFAIFSAHVFFFFVFNALQPLLQRHSGWGPAVSSPKPSMQPRNVDTAHTSNYDSCKLKVPGPWTKPLN